MKYRDGIYVSENKKAITVYTCADNKFSLLKETVFANELVEILETERENINNFIYSALDVDYNKAEKYFSVLDKFINVLSKENIVMGFLLGLEVKDKTSVDKANAVLRDFQKTFHDIYFYTRYYCHLDEDTEERIPHEEKIKSIFNNSTDFLEQNYKEVYVTAINNPQEFSFPFTKYYYFDKLTNFISFLFINTMKTEPNLNICFNCDKLFVAYTKKRTRYCDRVQNDKGDTCKKIGPVVRKELVSNLSCMQDYEKALHRNYKRLERCGDKNISYDDYTAWLDKVKIAKTKYLKEQISDEEFLEVINLLG